MDKGQLFIGQLICQLPIHSWHRRFIHSTAVAALIILHHLCRWLLCLRFTIARGATHLKPPHLWAKQLFSPKCWFLMAQVLVRMGVSYILNTYFSKKIYCITNFIDLGWFKVSIVLFFQQLQLSQDITASGGVSSSALFAARPAPGEGRLGWTKKYTFVRGNLGFHRLYVQMYIYIYILYITILYYIVFLRTIQDVNVQSSIYHGFLQELWDMLRPAVVRRGTYGCWFSCSFIPKPRNLRPASCGTSMEAKGDLTWFDTCSMLTSKTWPIGCISLLFVGSS